MILWFLLQFSQVNIMFMNRYENMLTHLFKYVLFNQEKKLCDLCNLIKSLKRLVRVFLRYSHKIIIKKENVATHKKKFTVFQYDIY